MGASFRNLDDLNAQLRHWLDTVANPRVHATTQRVVNETFAEEKPSLKPLPSHICSAARAWTPNATIACNCGPVINSSRVLRQLS